MITQQLHLFNSIGLIIFVVVGILTRATVRRVAGAVAGGAALGLTSLCASSPSRPGTSGLAFRRSIAPVRS